jgi:hypothetical protein
MLKLTCPAALVGGGTVQIDSGAGSEQVKVSVPLNPEVNATVTVAVALDPCATWKLWAVGVSVNGAATVNATDPAEWLLWVKTPVVAVIVTVPLAAELPDWMVAVVLMGSPPVGVTVVGLNEQVSPVGSPEHEKLTGALKLLIGVTVIVAVPLAPVNTVRLVVGVLAEKSGGAFKATAKLFTSREPNPVARS